VEQAVLELGELEVADEHGGVGVARGEVCDEDEVAEVARGLGSLVRVGPVMAVIARLHGDCDGAAPLAEVAQEDEAFLQMREAHAVGLVNTSVLYKRRPVHEPVHGPPRHT
jgi:hypothetical protein